GEIHGRGLGGLRLGRHRPRLEVLRPGEEGRVRVRHPFFLRPIRGDEAGESAQHHQEEERDDDERDHADAVLAQAPPGELPQARGLLGRGGRGVLLENGAHLKLTLGSTHLYITSTNRLMIMVSTARYTVTALITGKSLRFTAVMISRPRPGIEKNTSSRNEPTKIPGSAMPTLVRIGMSALRSTCFSITLRSDTPLARAVRT